MKRLFSSWRVALLLLALYTTLLAIATWVESHWSTAVANQYIYKSAWFIVLQILMVLSTIGVMIKSRLFQRKLYGVVTLHIALIMILVGALVTHLWGFEGYLHLREGESSRHMMLMNTDRNDVTTSYELPFTLTLDDFLLERYPGSKSPSSYESFLVVDHKGERREEHIYMNRVLDINGYRIFQSSYDPDEQGSLLSISYDPWGTTITYLGYFLMTLGFLVILFERGSYFSRRAKELSSLQRGMLTTLALLMFTPLGVIGGEATQITIPTNVSNSFARLQVQSPTGRMEPVGTYSEQLLRKLTRSGSYEGQSSDQVLLSIIAYPDLWSIEPIFSTSNPDMAEVIGIKAGEPFALSNLFVGGEYILDERVEHIYAKDMSQRNKLDKEILKIDERANILYAIQRGQLIPLFPIPNDASDKWVSSGDDLIELKGDDFMFVSKIMMLLIQEIRQAEFSGVWSGAEQVIDMINTYQQKRSNPDILQTPRQVEVELLYNRLSIFSYSAFSYMTFGLLLLILSLLHLNRPRKWTLWGLRAGIAIVVFIFLAHSAALIARGYISGRAPWANGYESMIYVAWSGVLAGLLFIRRSPLTLSMATLLGGIVLLVAHLNFLDPEITPLVPVLKSYWLMFHVAIITSSYGFFGMCFLLSLLNLSMVAFGKRGEQQMKSIKELYIISELSLTIGLALLSVGTFLGAVWANESWGRYWGWDPKETWALISMLVYALVLHARFIPRFNNNFSFNTLTIYAFGAIMMTYFGVNYFLGGLHSYAGGDTPPALWGVMATYVVATVVVIAAWVRERR